MADTDKNILITPNKGSTTADPNIVFTGGDNNPITLTVLDDGTLSFSGSAGQLFSVSDSLTGTIFSVNDISGIPSIEVDDTGEIRLAEFSGNVLIGTDVDNGSKLQVNGESTINKIYFPISDGTDYAGYHIGRKDGSGGTTISSYTDVWILADQNGDGSTQSVKLKAGTSGTEFVVKNTTVEFGGNKVFHAGNDGSGSGLDADLLDGQHASAFASVGHTHSYLPLSGGTVTGKLTLNNAGGDSILKFGPGLPGSDDAHIEWKGASNGGYLRISTSDDNGTEYVQFGDYDGTDRVGAFTEWGKMNRDYLYHSSDIRTPIFYDSNNTGYYVDPASTSNLNNVDANGEFYYNKWIRNNGTGASGLYWHNSSNPGYAWHIYPETRQDMTFRTGSGSGGIKGTISDTTARGYVHWTTSNEIGFLNNSRSWSLRVDSSGNSFHTGSARAPIFYDSNNTAYYVNPASTSNLNALDLHGSFKYDNSQDYDATNINLTSAPISNRVDHNVGTADAFLPVFKNTAMYSSGYRTHLNVGLFKRASGWGDNNTGMYVALGGSDSYPTKYWKLTYGHSLYNSEGYVSTPGSFRAPIFYDSNNTGYYLNPSSTGTSINIAGILVEASDAKLKTNLERIPDALNKVKQLNGYTYDRIDNNMERQAGVIAQEVEAVLPEVVRQSGDHKSVSYGNMVSLLIEAIKEQQEQIDDLKSKINSLEGK
jgi:putative lipoic acid-binding regulatory protein